jgi:uncharacterized protein
MKPADLNPQRLDVAKFARAGTCLEGQVPLGALQRLSEGTCAPDDAQPGLVTWRATGSQRGVLGGVPELRLHLQAQATVWLNCQRCLQPVAVSLPIDRVFRFARDDDEAAQLDETSEEEDVLALGRPLDLMSLLEDELIMALPIVPRHETCPQPLQALVDAGPGTGASGPAAAAGVDGAADDAARPNPFAVLGQLKRQRPS